MCRAVEEGGRRCPGVSSPEHRKQLNQRRRERYASQKNGQVRAYVKTSTSVEPVTSLPHLTRTFEQLGLAFSTVLNKPFNEELYTPVRNSDSFTLEKPSGALWCSPVEDEVSAWQNFMGDDNYWTQGHTQEIVLDETSRILVIDSYDDYVAASEVYHRSLPVPDYMEVFEFLKEEPNGSLNYEGISKDYDALFMTGKALYECSYGRIRDKENTLAALNAWDVPSLVVFNPKKITKTPKQ